MCALSSTLMRKYTLYLDMNSIHYRIRNLFPTQCNSWPLYIKGTYDE